MERPEKELLEVHRALLERWRGAMNLVGPGAVEPHYDDASAALELLDDERPAGRWADLGTGAGFPGIVFAARFPGVALDLVDSRQKRCAFLEHVLREAGLGRGAVTIRCARIESLADGSYDGLLARALAPPPVVLAHALRLLRPRGRILLMMGDEDLVPPPGLERVAARRYPAGGRTHRAVLLRRGQVG